MKQLKVILALATLAMSLALVGCGSSEPEATPPTDAPKTSDTQADGATGATPGAAPSNLGGPTND